MGHTKAALPSHAWALCNAVLTSPLKMWRLVSFLQQQEIAHEMAVTTNKTVSAISSLMALVSFPHPHEKMVGAPRGQRLNSTTSSSLEGARNLFVVDMPACISQKKPLLSAAPPNKANNRMLTLPPLAPGSQLGSQSPTAWQKLRAAFCFHLPLCAPDRDVTKLQIRQGATVMSALLGIRN